MAYQCILQPQIGTKQRVNSKSILNSRTMNLDFEIVDHGAEKLVSRNVRLIRGLHFTLREWKKQTNRYLSTEMALLFFKIFSMKINTLHQFSKNCFKCQMSTVKFDLNGNENDYTKWTISKSVGISYTLNWYRVDVVAFEFEPTFLSSMKLDSLDDGVSKVKFEQAIAGIGVKLA